jgi:glutamate 5-kinase
VRLVIKIGSNIVADTAGGLNTRRMRSLALVMAEVQDLGHQVTVVSSGAVAAGMRKLGMRQRPRDIKLKQAAAAVGQSALMWAYERSFAPHGRKVAQVLLTRDGLSDRRMYLNAKNTLLTLLDHDVVPIVNENDTVAVDEIRFGDNDNLAALVASLLDADRLIILSDVEGLYDQDPAHSKRAVLLKCVTSISAEMIKRAGDASSAVGTGGMYSKLLAARKALTSGITVHIINGRKPRLLRALIEGRDPGTRFEPELRRLSARKGWIAHGSRTKGTLVLDDGAVRALRAQLRSLLPSGIVSVEGTFQTGDAVSCTDRAGNRVAKGITNYSSDEVEKIRGRKTSQIEAVLGYRYSDEVIHRDNMVMVG